MSSSVVGTEVFHRVQDDKVRVRENYVGIAVHYLYEEIKSRVVSHLRPRGEAQADYPVVLPHPDIFQRAHRKVFAQEHTEVGRGRGILFSFCREVQSGRARVAGGDQALRFSARTQKKADLIRFRLDYFVHTRAFQAGVEFVCERAQRKKITAHGYIIHVFRPRAMQKSIAFRQPI